ncbi:ShlB/FhaC/HecB family hemolysin secretion/activation protein [Rhodopirellula sp. P2]|uniref:ShlB/FhaC/HecB family hemolysin secretion/activation protein n=1 Tax=Rhodopirellula sp. P2 TaxID=2127060 RepID=UPI0023678022|nr:ShlB/FhaC/HecB family hemolysin secretion/activation protein [Rhodopirellula sp. P2]WDQ14957.1 ShlB/FhaC/HecB family hemolysin secretion/activation protein [Rhodopirellula sp. P2]
MTLRRLEVLAGWICAASLLFSSSAFGQNFERYRPKVFQPWEVGKFDLDLQTEKDAETPSSDVVLVDALEAVILLPSRDEVDPHEAYAEFDGVHSRIHHSGSLANSARVQSIVEAHLGHPITLRNLNKMTRQIIEVYEQGGQPIVDVQIPEQKITGGTIQIVIVESRIGAIQVKGGCWVDPCLLRQGITRSRVGGRIHESCVSEDLYWLNRSPFRSVGLDVKPGSFDGTSDLTFEVEDVFPMRAYMGYEDTGVEALRLERLYTGLLIGNVFGFDGLLGYQYTADSEFSRLHAHAVSYTVDPSRERGYQVFGSWASAAPALPAPMTQDGEAWQVGTRAFHYTTRTSRLERAWFIGTDFKSSNTSVEFGALNTSATAADLLQLSVGYNALVRENNGDYARLNTIVNYGPDGGFTSQNNAAAFNSLRQNTAPGYVYWRTSMDMRRQVGCDYEWTFRGAGQVSSERLLFSETLGFGGYDSIRGYDQRVASGDNGWLTSFEFGPNAWTFGSGDCERNVKAYTFADLGQAFILDSVAGEADDQFLSSVGVGCRIAVGQKGSLRFDYGHGFNDVLGADAGDRVHVGFVSFFGPTPN